MSKFIASVIAVAPWKIGAARGVPERFCALESVRLALHGGLQ